MNVLVTGATGCLGRNLVTRLLHDGYNVTATGRNEAIGQELTQAGALFVKADLEDEASMLSLCAGKDRVFHSGAFSSPWGKYQDFYAANVRGTQNIITGCMQHKIKRLIYVSTPSIYFDYKERLGIKETDPLPAQPVNHYAATKRLAEQKIDEAFRQGLRVITLRPRAIIGPFDTAIMPRILRASRAGRVPLINGGKALIDVTYVGNVVEAILLAIHAPEHALGKKYNITNDQPIHLGALLEKTFQALGMAFTPKHIPYKAAYSLAAIMETIGKISSYEPMLTRYSVGILARSQTLDISSAKQDLSYTPVISLDEGIARYAAWWREHHG